MAPTSPLDPEELLFYGRQLVLPGVGLAGQERLKTGSAVVVGAGGLGSSALLYLAAAGVGRLGLVDFDRVSVSNLHRQVLYAAGDEGRPKAAAAKARLEALNPHIDVEAHEQRLSGDNALDILGDYDVVLDGTDNFPTRYLTNDACVLLGKPSVHASVFRFEGQASVFWAPKGPCYRCLVPRPPSAGLVPSCAEGGVLGVLPGVLGLIQATEALKILLGTGQTLIGRLLLYDALGARFDEMPVRRDPDCPACGRRPGIRDLARTEELCRVWERGDVVTPADVSAPELAKRREGGEVVVVDVRDPWEHELVRIDGARLIPLAEIGQRAAELPHDRDIVVYCHSGPRSIAAVGILRQLGFARASSLAGGIVAWVREVEPEKPIY